MKKRRKAKRLRRRGRSPTQSDAEGQLMLAASAVKGRATALDDSPDNSAAAACFSFTVVHREILREIAELPVRRREVAQRRSARCDGLIEHPVDRGHQPLKTRERKRTPCPFRMDAGTIQSFADINIAETRDDALIEEQ